MYCRDFIEKHLKQKTVREVKEKLIEESKLHIHNKILKEKVKDSYQLSEIQNLLNLIEMHQTF